MGFLNKFNKFFGGGRGYSLYGGYRQRYIPVLIGGGYGRGVSPLYYGSSHQALDFGNRFNRFNRPNWGFSQGAKQNILNATESIGDDYEVTLDSLKWGAEHAGNTLTNMFKSAVNWASEIFGVSKPFNSAAMNQAPQEPKQTMDNTVTFTA